MSTTCVDCSTILTTVVSITCKFGFLHDDEIKSSVRMSSTRFSSPDDSSISVPLLKLAALSVVVLVGLTAPAPLLRPLLWPPFALAGDLRKMRTTRVDDVLIDDDSSKHCDHFAAL